VVILAAEALTETAVLRETQVGRSLAGSQSGPAVLQ
jgi:hypothetical protein